MSKQINQRSEKDIILDFISLGRGKLEVKEAMAEELGISLSTLKYRVKKFKDGNGIGRKKRCDAGIPKKDPATQKKLAFFAELAMGTSADQAAELLGLTEHQANRLSSEFKKKDKFEALRQAPQLEDLKELIKDVYRIDMATVYSELHGAFPIEFADRKISISVEHLNDLKIIIAHCLQLDEMTKIDPDYKHYSKSDLENMRVYYLKQELLQKKNVAEYAALRRATDQKAPERMLDLKLMYGVIEHLNPGMDEASKLQLIKDVALKMKMIK